MAMDIQLLADGLLVIQINFCGSSLILFRQTLARGRTSNLCNLYNNVPRLGFLYENKVCWSTAEEPNCFSFFCAKSLKKLTSNTLYKYFIAIASNCKSK